MFEQNLFVGIREGLVMLLYHLQQLLLLFLLVGDDTVEWLYQCHTKHRSPPSTLSASFEVQCRPHYFPMRSDRGWGSCVGCQEQWTEFWWVETRNHSAVSHVCLLQWELCAEDGLVVRSFSELQPLQSLFQWAQWDQRMQAQSELH